MSLNLPLENGQAITKNQDAKKAGALKGKVSAAAPSLARPQLARPSTKAALNVAKPEPVKVVSAEPANDQEATLYFSPENAKPKLRVLPPNVDDFDGECGNDPYQAPQYAQDIFTYFKQREVSS